MKKVARDFTFKFAHYYGITGMKIPAMFARLFALVAVFTAVSISSGARAASALEQLATSMQPGTWAQLSVPNQNSILGVGSISGSMIHYCNAMPWNPVTKKIEIIGMDHNWGRERYVQYDMATNSFVLVSADLGFGSDTRHCYDHTAVNPATGVVYNRLGNIAKGVLTVRYASSGSSNFSVAPTIATGYDQIAIGATWWSGPFVGAGNQGAFVIFNSGDVNGSTSDGQIVAWDPVKNSWIFNKKGMSPNYLTSGSTYHSVIEYSSQKNVAVFGGGNDAPRKLWRLNADGTSVAMPDVPAGKSVGIQKGNLVNDPVTGNFLLLSAGQLWELNPDGAGTWTQLTGTRTPPNSVGNPLAPDGVISAAISDYGVVAYITQSSSIGGTFYLYKHAVSGAADATAPTINLTGPAAGTVSGNVTLSASASDNVGIAGVQFKVDGANLSTEDTIAPYSIIWDSTTTTNGSHTVTAVARDAAGNQTVSTPVIVTVSNLLDTTPNAFSFTSQAGVAPSTAVTSNAVTPAGYNAAAAINVSGGSFSVNGGAFVTTAGTISPGQTVAVRLTTSGSNNTQTCATLNIGGVSGQFCATTSAPSQTIPPIVGGQDFTTRCTQAGVLKCVGFDNATDFNIGNGGVAGAYGLNSGIYPPSGTSDYTRATRDTSTSASGSSSLRFTIPSNSGSDSSGSYFTNFSSDLSVQFGAGEEFYVQWRQRFSPEFLNTVYSGGGGWKQVIIGTGDQPGILYSSCSTLELPVQNTYQRGFPVMYNSCSGSASHGPYNPFEEPFGAFDFKLQNGRAAPYCLYSQSSTGYFPPNGNCFRYVANEWMTFQVRVQIGPRVGDEFRNSTITLWGAREGAPSELLIQYGPYNLSAGSLAENQRYGKVWLLPYHTGKSSAQAHPTAYTWYDELIISRNKIEDPPVSGGGTNTPTVTIGASPTSIVSGSSSLITWSSTNSTSCTASNGWTGAKSTSGQQSVTPTATTTYTLVCSGTNGSATQSTTVNVSAPPNPPTVSIGSSPTSIVSGSSSLITWSSTNSTSCTASNGWTGAKSTSGQQSVTPTATTTYTLVCSGTNGSATQSTTVNVSTVPSAPIGVTATASAGAATVSFSAPASNGGTAIIEYSATCSSTNGGILGSNTGTPSAASIRVSGLTNGKGYTCSVKARNSAGFGPASIPSNPVTPINLAPILNILLDD